MSRQTMRVYLTLVVMTIAATSTKASIVTYLDRSTFDTATAGFGISTTETFGSFAADTLLSSNAALPTSFTGFDVYHQGTGGPLPAFPGVSVQIVDVLPYTNSGLFAPGPSPYLVPFAAATGNPIDGLSSQTFVQPIAGTRAFGFDFRQWGDGLNTTDLQVTTNVGVFSVPNPITENGFLGFHTTAPGETVESVTWIPTSGSQGYDGIGIDDVSVVANASGVVPESSTLIVWSLLALTAGSCRRRSRGCETDV